MKTLACQLCIYLWGMHISRRYTWPPIICFPSSTKKRTTKQVTGGGYISSHVCFYNYWSNCQILSSLSSICCPLFLLQLLRPALYWIIIKCIWLLLAYKHKHIYYAYYLQATMDLHLQQDKRRAISDILFEYIYLFWLFYNHILLQPWLHLVP